MTSFMWAAIAAVANGWFAIGGDDAYSEAFRAQQESWAAQQKAMATGMGATRTTMTGDFIDVEAVDITDQKQIGYEVKA